MNFRIQQHHILHKMAAREPSRYLAKALPRAFAPSARPQAFIGRRNASDEAPSRRLSDELETASSLTSKVSDSAAKSFDPVSRASARRSQLPRSRYVKVSWESRLLTRKSKEVSHTTA
jgi:large subunit ribosomal protein L5